MHVYAEFSGAEPARLLLLGKKSLATVRRSSFKKLRSLKSIEKRVEEPSDSQLLAMKVIDFT